MAKLNIANLKKTLYYLQRNGLRETWISVRERLTETDRYFYVPCPEEELERQSCRKWDNPVTLSIVVPLYRTPEIYLNRMITSVMQQSYPHWELILADATEDHSVEETLTNQGFLTERLLENAETIAADARIHYIHLTENAGIAANTNQALPYARGEYIGLLDHDDVLTPDALYEMADAITKANDRGVRVAFAYSDEDKCNGDETKYYDPNHKEDFNYDLILSNNYICHFLVMDADLMKKLAFRPECDGAQDYDLVLRAVSEVLAADGRSGEERILHIPRVLSGKNRGRIAGGRMTADGKVFYEGLPKDFGGYLHRAELSQDAEALDLRCIRIRSADRELFEKIVGVPYTEVVRGPEQQPVFDSSTLPAGADIRLLSLQLSDALRKRGRLLYLPEYPEKWERL